VLIGRLLVCVALGAGYLLRGGVMHQTLHILVAIHASKHSAVDGVLLLVGVHIQVDLLAIHLHRQGGVGVTGKAILVLGLMLGAAVPAQASIDRASV